jgi:chloramphenicol-sensitive protein RarD
MNRGIWYAVSAYGLWGFIPIYWKLMQEIPAVQIIGHRVIWSFLLLVAIILIKGDWAGFRNAISNKSIYGAYGVAAALLSVNWGIYIWAVNAGFIVETSLGYFINPLLSVFLGMIFFREKLRPLQWLPIAMMVAGVFYLTFAYGRLPWIALVLAFTFALYGLIKKTSPLGALNGLALETGLMVPPALLFLGYLQSQGTGVIGQVSAGSHLLLVMTGLVTALPLLLFAGAARRIHLSTMGLLQYMAPTLQFLVGILIYREPFTLAQLAGFGIIWVALAIYTTESMIVYRRKTFRNPVTPATPYAGHGSSSNPDRRNQTPS